MPLRDGLAALVVIVVWGMNFVVIKWGLTEIPPLLLGALRFGFVAFPAVFFIRRPAIAWQVLLRYGATISLGQFVFLFSALHLGMPAGLASVVLQSQAFFTVVIAAFVFHEPVRRQTIVGMVIALAGLVAIQQGAAVGNMTLIGFLMTLFAALSWATGNIVAKGVPKTETFPLVVWGALVPPLPFLALSLVFEGPQAMLGSLQGISLQGVLVVAYLSVGATLVGYGLWGWLLARHPASLVAPLTLLVPVLGLVSASLLLGERLSVLQWVGGGVILLALVINSFGGQLARRLRRAGL